MSSSVKEISWVRTLVTRRTEHGWSWDLRQIRGEHSGLRLLWNVKEKRSRSYQEKRREYRAPLTVMRRMPLCAHGEGCGSGPWALIGPAWRQSDANNVFVASDAGLARDTSLWRTIRGSAGPTHPLSKKSPRRKITYQSTFIKKGAPLNTCGGATKFN